MTHRSGRCTKLAGDYQNRRAQSEVIGVILLTAVIVILVVLVGSVILGSLDTQDEPATNLRAEVDATQFTLGHHGGSTLARGDVTVILRDGNTRRRTLDEFGDGVFAPGEKINFSHGAAETLRVLVIHDPSNTVLYDQAFDVPARTFPKVTWDSAADWNDAAAENGVVHADFGDHRVDRIELGYPADDTGLLAYWPLDEDGGSTATDVVGPHDGTIQGATTDESGVLATTSYAFDGTDDHVSGATDISALRNTASLSFWIRSTQNGDDIWYEAPGITGVESDGDVDDIFWGWIDSTGHIGVQAGDDSGAGSSTVVADGTWHHVVLTRDAATGDVEVYVDGDREDFATSRSGEITTTFDGIGRIEDTGGTPEYFSGRIDEVRVYDRVLSESTVGNLSSQEGSLTTAEKRFEEPVDPSNLTLEDVKATVPSGTSISLFVESDPENDGTFSRSDEIRLDGSGSYDVTGLANDSRIYRLRIELQTDSVTTVPSFDAATLTTE